MIIFSEHINPRLTYTLNHIFREQLGVNYSVTSNFNKFLKAPKPKINYSKQQDSDSFQIIPEGLLFAEDISSDKPLLSLHRDQQIIFKQEGGDFSFDIFSAVFWFISRYEEYQAFKPDSYNRFPATESFAFKNGILNKPLVDEWLMIFRQELVKIFPTLELKRNRFTAITTIDVDSPWCYKNKGLFRNTGGLLRDVLKGHFRNALFRIKVVLNANPDPWYNFEWITNLTQKAGIELLFFIHVGDFGKYDKTVNANSKAFKKFINSIVNRAEIGLHPSYKAASDNVIFQIELKRLSGILNRDIRKSRQHFLVFQVAEYYPQLMQLGIEEDYSMGFADKPGFRAGTSQSFYFFDLNKNQETKLHIHPFAIMDRTLNSYEGQSAEKAVDTVKIIIENLKMVNGTFVSLWHNESLSNTFEWKGWKSAFQQITEYLAQGK